ncbi:hypothetical protein NM688_g3831 [Phlebia brevispora]|uniref:Uncharacterized protein n=1 Tax=Phlebia brevispora TaxID=194682 RepID=A0ACC1T5A9_9APHY|nr:hypothetical protein NM688_g3831 [Phlebia brevispora]
MLNAKNSKIRGGVLEPGGGGRGSPPVDSTALRAVISAARQQPSADRQMTPCRSSHALDIIRIKPIAISLSMRVIPCGRDPMRGLRKVANISTRLTLPWVESFSNLEVRLKACAGSVFLDRQSAGAREESIVSSRHAGQQSNLTLTSNTSFYGTMCAGNAAVELLAYDVDRQRICIIRRCILHVILDIVSRPPGISRQAEVQGYLQRYFWPLRARPVACDGVHLWMARIVVRQDVRSSVAMFRRSSSVAYGMIPCYLSVLLRLLRGEVSGTRVLLAISATLVFL